MKLTLNYDAANNTAGITKTDTENPGSISTTPKALAYVLSQIKEKKWYKYSEIKDASRIEKDGLSAKIFVGNSHDPVVIFNDSELSIPAGFGTWMSKYGGFDYQLKQLRERYMYLLTDNFKEIMRHPYNNSLTPRGGYVQVWNFTNNKWTICRVIDLHHSRSALKELQDLEASMPIFYNDTYVVPQVTNIQKELFEAIEVADEVCKWRIVNAADRARFIRACVRNALKLMANETAPTFPEPEEMDRSKKASAEIIEKIEVIKKRDKEEEEELNNTHYLPPVESIPSTSEETS